MSRATNSDLETWIGGMMLTKNIKEYSVDIGGNSTKGDGYLGEITFVTVTTPQKVYHVVVKSAKTSEQLREQTPIKETYDREIFFYSKILPALEQFQEAKALEKPFRNYPKCYTISSVEYKEAILLENLKVAGFQLHDRKNAMNLDHILCVFKSYGRFHALSYAFRLQKKIEFDGLMGDMGDLMSEFIKKGKMLAVFEENFRYGVKLLEEKGYVEAVKKLEGYEQNFEEILCDLPHQHTKLKVILHGDCWNNNFMFKYEESNTSKPIDMRFLDFQLTRASSAIMDLSYFFYLCADKESLKKFDHILAVYHSSLSESLRNLGVTDDEDQIPSIEVLREEWKKFGRYGFALVFLILKIALCESDDAPDLSSSAENGDFQTGLRVKIKDSSDYDQRLVDILLHFSEKYL